jgi:Ca2+-binding EF-hand superfamily protein
LTVAQGGRSDRYAAELARVTEDDNICKQFAGLASPLVAKIESSRAAINDAKDFKQGLAAVKAAIAENLGADCIGKINELQHSIDQRGVTKNKHSNLTAQDVVVRIEQYNAYLASKKAQLEEQILLNESRGLTAEQIAEINQQFKSFDKNGNGFLDVSEFKTCLYSLGEEKTKAETQALLTQFGDGKVVSLEGFKNFMFKILGDSNTQQEITDGFKLLADDCAAVTEKQLSDVFPLESDVVYLKAEAPKAGDKIDYAPWTVAVFGR